MIYTVIFAFVFSLMDFIKDQDGIMKYFKLAIVIFTLIIILFKVYLNKEIFFTLNIGLITRFFVQTTLDSIDNNIIDSIIEKNKKDYYEGKKIPFNIIISCYKGRITKRYYDTFYSINKNYNLYPLRSQENFMKNVKYEIDFKSYLKKLMIEYFTESKYVFVKTDDINIYIHQIINILLEFFYNLDNCYLIKLTNNIEIEKYIKSELKNKWRLLDLNSIIILIFQSLDINKDIDHIISIFSYFCTKELNNLNIINNTTKQDIINGKVNILIIFNTKYVCNRDYCFGANYFTAFKLMPDYYFMIDGTNQNNIYRIIPYKGHFLDLIKNHFSYNNNGEGCSFVEHETNVYHTINRKILYNILDRVMNNQFFEEILLSQENDKLIINNDCYNFIIDVNFTKTILIGN